MRHYQVTLTGKTPLLMHSDNIQWADQMESWKNDPANKKASKAGDDRTPAFRWIGNCYHDGRVVSIPQENLMRSFMEGGAMVPVPGGRSGKTFKSQTQSGMMTTEAFWPLSLSDGTLIQWADIDALMDEPSFADHAHLVQELGFSLFVKRARIGQSKHIRVRPRFDDWTVTGEIAVWDQQLTLDVLKSILTYAGQFKGLCDWRPGSKTPGAFGMFSAEIEEI